MEGAKGWENACLERAGRVDSVRPPRAVMVAVVQSLRLACRERGNPVRGWSNFW